MPNFQDSVSSAYDSLLSNTQTGNVTATLSKSSDKVASSVYESGVSDSLIAVDRFGKRAPSTINQTVSGISGKVSGFFKNFEVLQLAKTTVKEAISTANSTLKTVTNAKRQLESYTGVNLNNLGSLKNNISRAAVTTLSNVTGYDATRLYSNGTQVYRIATTANRGDVNSLLSATARILGNDAVSGVLDTQSESAILSSLLTQSSSLGMVNVFNKLYDKVSTNDKQYSGNVAASAASASLYTVVSNGDTEMLSALVDRLGGSTVLSQHPTVLSSVLSNYTIPFGKTTADYPALRAEIIALFAKIDPDWESYQLAGSTVYRLDPFIPANSAALAVFGITSLPIDQPPTELNVSPLIASTYGRQSAASLMRLYYPTIVY